MRLGTKNALGKKIPRNNGDFLSKQDAKEMPVMLKRAIFIFFIFCLLPAGLFSDTVWLKDGSLLNGKILDITDEGIQLKSFRGVFIIPKNKISRYEKDPEEEVEPAKSAVDFERKEGMWQVAVFLGGGLNGVMADVNTRPGYKEPQALYQFGFQIGGTGSYFFSSTLALQGSLGFERSRLKVLWEKDTASHDYSQTYAFNHLNFQIGAKWYWYQNFYAQLGIYYGIALAEPQVDIEELGSINNFPVSERFPDGEWGGILGVDLEAGYEWYFGEKYYLGGALKIQGSFSSAFDARVPNADGAGTVSPRVYMLLLSFGIIF